MSEWISVEDRFPDTDPRGYKVEMSSHVLVKSEKTINGKKALQYPFVAHLHKDGKGKYRNYFYAKVIGDYAYTWLNPYHDHVELQHITHWMPLPDKPKGDRV